MRGGLRVEENLRLVSSNQQGIVGRLQGIQLAVPVFRAVVVCRKRNVALGHRVSPAGLLHVRLFRVDISVSGERDVQKTSQGKRMADRGADEGGVDDATAVRATTATTDDPAHTAPCIGRFSATRRFPGGSFWRSIEHADHALRRP